MFRKLQARFILVVLALAFGTGMVASTPKITSATGELDSYVEGRIDALIAQMTLEEKISMIGGSDYMDTNPVPRLGIPSIHMTDGPVGVRDVQGRPTTSFPAGIAMGASFDPNLIKQVAKAMADETRFYGKNMLLGPCVNLSRQPFGGRNFESFGEDPFLTSQLAKSYVQGVQGQNVLASVKHFALNEQETDRMSIDVQADLRAMFELHFPAFKTAIDAGSWTVMASYNKVGGHHATENEFLLKTILKERWGFKGFVVSDWESVHSVVEAANNGLDLEMPKGLYFGPDLIKAVQDGLVAETTINDKVRRLIRAMYVVGIMEPWRVPAVAAPVGPGEIHNALARKLAQESTVLLKNQDRILPLRFDKVKKLAVIGPNAAIARTGGGGSSHVNASNAVSPLKALQTRYGRIFEIQYALGTRLPPDLEVIPSQYLRPSLDSKVTGLHGEYFQNVELAGPPSLSRIDAEIDFNSDALRASGFKDHFSIRWTGFLRVPTSGLYKLSTLSDDGVRLFVDDKEIISNWTHHGSTADHAEIELEAGRDYAIRLEYFQSLLGVKIQFGWTPPNAESLLAEAVRVASESDVALIFVGMGNDESEGFDRPHMDLPEGQNELIKAVVAANPNTVVILNGGNPVRMGQWINQVRGVLHVWYPGQAGADSTVDLLMGLANPSGKLPVTFIKRWEDSAAYGNYPGEHGKVEYKESIFLGYRHADARNIEPEFPFGFGLSYTEFAFSNLHVEIVSASVKNPKIRVYFDVLNTGAVAGAEVPQLYVGEMNPILARPVKELKSFQKIYLLPREKRSVRMDLDRTSFAYFDAEKMEWKIKPGKFKISVGSSSRDLVLSEDVILR